MGAVYLFDDAIALGTHSAGVVPFTTQTMPHCHMW